METERLDLPFVAGGVVDPEMVEAEDHGQLMGSRVGVTDAVFQSGGRHFADGNDVVISAEGIPVQLLKIFVDPGAVRIIFLSVSGQVVFIDPGF